MSGIQLTIFWAPPRAWVTSSVLPFVAHSLSSRLQLPVLHCCCCSWWSSHGTGISKSLLSSTVIRLHQQPLIGSLHGDKLLLLCMTPSSPGPSIATEAAPSPMAFHGLWLCQEPQLLFMTPSCLQNQYHLGDSYTVPSLVTAQNTSVAISGTHSLCSQKTLPRRFHLSDAGLFLITANFLAPANQHQYSQ